jgi:hypothetical protein
MDNAHIVHAHEDDHHTQEHHAWQATAGAQDIGTHRSTPHVQLDGQVLIRLLKYSVFAGLVCGLVYNLLTASSAPTPSSPTDLPPS